MPGIESQLALTSPKGIVILCLFCVLSVYESMAYKSISFEGDIAMRHCRAISQRPVPAQDTSELDFIIATLTFIVTVLGALQTKKASQA